MVRLEVCLGPSGRIDIAVLSFFNPSRFGSAMMLVRTLIASLLISLATSQESGMCFIDSDKVKLWLLVFSRVATLSYHIDSLHVLFTWRLFSAAPECPEPWIPESNNCYLFSSESLPWLDARIACEVSNDPKISCSIFLV